MTKLFLLFLTLVSDVYSNDGTADGYLIWNDLGITQQEYFYLSGLSGLTFGFIFSLSIIILLTRR